MLIEGRPLEAPAASLHELAAHPDDVALVSLERRMCWRELEGESLRLAGAYLELGLERGDRIASLMPNRIALVVHYLACFRAGLVVTPLNYRYTHREIDHALAGFPIDEGYGMTEVGLATLNPPRGPIKQGSIGPPIGGFHISLRDESGAQVEQAGTVGRVWIRTRSRMAGYWDAPEATAEILDRDWLDSGDLARADEDGYLWFFGRKKQVIVHDGSNISPLEVEGALTEHPAVALAGVVGIHDAVHGENARAYVTLRPGAERPSSADLIVHCRDRIGYKAPEEIVFLDEMPLNPTGKIDRVGLKKMAEDHLHPHGLD